MIEQYEMSFVSYLHRLYTTKTSEDSIFPSKYCCLQDEIVLELHYHRWKKETNNLRFTQFFEYYIYI